MCGIAGIYNHGTGAPADGALLRSMTRRIAHRGPDGEGHHVDGPLGLGHRRLSVIDLSDAGRQPLSNEDGSVWITFNGEFYGYRDWVPYLESRGHRFRSATDTEVLVHLYEEFGTGFLDKVDGMFAFALWDARAKRLLLARDRLGIKPLYYCLDDRRLLFASEMKALLADPSLPRRLDADALTAFMHVMSIPDPHSIFQGIRKLPAAHALTIDPSGTRLWAYWDVPAVEEGGGADLDAAAGEFRDAFGRSVSAHMVADVPVGAFLSGGVDSSAIVAVARRHATGPLNTCSMTFPDMAGFDEGDAARAVAEHCATAHVEVPFRHDMIDALPRMVWHADEPFAVASALGVYHLARAARDRVKVVLSGDGADEVFAGYPWRHDAEAPLVGSGAAHAYASSFTVQGGSAIRELLTPDVAAAATASLWIPSVEAGLSRFADADITNRRLYTDIKTTLVSEMLTKVDRMTMAHGLEARVPFLDHRLVEWAFRVPPRLKIDGGSGKRLVRHAMAPLLPPGLLDRPKHGFNVPIGLWLRGPLRDFLTDSLAPERVRRRGLLRAEAVSRRVEEHLSGRRDHGTALFILLCLELWCSQYLDGRGEEP